MRRLQIGNFWQENGATVELQIKTAELAVKYAEIACESGAIGFDGASRSHYVERS
jgi:hypothetical protein